MQLKQPLNLQTIMADVKKIRTKYNLTQQELADKCGVTLRTVQNWERGKTIPESALKLLQKMFGDYESVSPSEEGVNLTPQDIATLGTERFLDVILKQQKIMNRQLDVLESQLDALNKRDERIERILSRLEER